VETRGGMSAVSTYQKIESYGDFFRTLLGLDGVGLGGILCVVGFLGVAGSLEPGGFFVEIGACEFVVEVQGGVWEFFEGIEEAFV